LHFTSNIINLKMIIDSYPNKYHKMLLADNFKQQVYFLFLIGATKPLKVFFPGPTKIPTNLGKKQIQ